MNLGLGIGAVIGGLVVHVREPGTFVAVYLIDGTSNLAVVAALALLPKTRLRPASTPRSALESGAPRAPVGDGQSRPGGYRAVLADGLFRRYALTMTVLMLAGYAAVNTGFVGFATSVAKAGPGTIAVSFAANTSFIVLTQPLALRLVRPHAAHDRARGWWRRPSPPRGSCSASPACARARGAARALVVAHPGRVRRRARCCSAPSTARS